MRRSRPRQARSRRGPRKISASTALAPVEVCDQESGRIGEELRAGPGWLYPNRHDGLEVVNRDGLAVGAAPGLCPGDPPGAPILSLSKGRTRDLQDLVD